MYLCSYDRKLLRAMRKAQGDEARYVAVVNNYAFGTNSHEHQDVEASLAAGSGVLVPVPSTSLIPSLESLKEKGLINRATSGSVYQVTHSGYHNNELRIHEIAYAVITHVLFPSAVAVLTAWLTVTLSS